MTYRDSLAKAMVNLSQDERVMFMGYNVAYGHQFNGTLSQIRKEQLLEMPVAENLIVGMAIGMSLCHYRPIVCIERMDFLWAAADAIINHLDKVERLGWSPPRVIIRTCIGTDTPLDPGIQHKGDYVKAFKSALLAPVLTIGLRDNPVKVYEKAYEMGDPVMVVEYRKFYDLPTCKKGSSKPQSSHP